MRRHLFGLALGLAVLAPLSAHAGGKDIAVSVHVPGLSISYADPGWGRVTYAPVYRPAPVYYGAPVYYAPPVYRPVRPVIVARPLPVRPAWHHDHRWDRHDGYRPGRHEGHRHHGY